MDSCADATLVGMSGKTGLQWIAMLCALGALIAYASRSAFRPVAQAATPSGGLTFADDFAEPDRQWVRAAILEARPEARALIAAVVGRTRIAPNPPADPMAGRARPLGAGRYEVRLNLARLDSDRTIDRDTVTLHELAHVVDFALVPDDLRDRLAAQVPRSGTCWEGFRGDCANAQERFADTFAKWALRGKVSIAGAGYSLAAPASLEDWGAPLARMAVELQATARE
jgi:hypothetical protein